MRANHLMPLFMQENLDFFQTLCSCHLSVFRTDEKNIIFILRFVFEVILRGVEISFVCCF